MLMECEYDLLQRLKGLDSIRVYGTGKTGQLLSRWLQKHQVRIQEYIVTEKQTVQYGGANVISVKQASKDTDSTVLVAVTSKYRKEIEKILIERGFSNIISLTDECIEKIEWLQDRGLYFQTHIVDHCNLKCRGCYHFSSLADESFLDLGEFEQDIKRLGELFDYKMERILLLGGEPLLHPEIEKFVIAVRRYFPEGNLQILTNGLLLLQMPREFYETMLSCEAELWVTKYPVAFDYEKAERYAYSFGVKIHYFNAEPVRTLGYQPLDIYGQQDARNNFVHCYRANECIDLKHGRMYPCIIPAEIKPFCDYFDVNIPVDQMDSVDIYEVKTGAELLDRLKRPISFCRYCNRDDVHVFGKIPWSHTEFNIREWTV